MGKFVNAAIYGSISDRGIYTGYVETKKAGAVTREPVYIISRQKVTDTIDGMVIAIAEQEGDGGIKPIVALAGEIFYEPEIHQLLSELRNFTYTKLTCLYEKSCGAVVFYRTGTQLQILLVKNHNGKYWSFPKGHMEIGESEQETAIREIKEETGLTVTLLEGYRQISDYVPFGRIKKRVVFFLAETKTNQVHIQHSEIDTYTWVSFIQAQKMCNYENDLRVLRTAQEALQNLNILPLPT